MNNNTISYDDIDYEPQYNKCMRQEDSISKLCIPIYNATETKPIGSGIIVTKNGIFLSVAHNFKNPNIQHKTKYNNKTYEIGLLYHEYGDGKDLAIGQLVDFEDNSLTDKDEHINDSAKNLILGSELILTGYKSKLLYDAEFMDEIEINGDLTLIKQRICRRYVELTQKNPLFLAIQEWADTVIPFEYHTHGEHLKGFSGGPVHDGTTLYGIVVSHVFLKIDYIKKIFKNIRK